MKIKFISASAGSGKTYRITEELYNRLSSGAARPDAIIGTTFTVKAANELVERVRLKLLNEGKQVFAHAINMSLINTVNSVCHSLLERFAFVAGISPKLDVLDEKNAPILFARSLEDILDKNMLSKLSSLQFRLGIENKFEGIDWSREVKRIVDLSRANGIDPDKFPALADESTSSLLSYFDSPTMTGEQIETELVEAIDELIRNIDFKVDETKTTKDYVSDLGKFKNSVVKRYSVWSDWVRVSKAGPAKKSGDIALRVQAAAANYERHPGLHEDLSTWIRLIFEVASKALVAYKAEKNRLGVIDFIDQENLCLEILQNNEVCEALASELDLLLVDEFQDTSPIQLALFTKLSTLANESIWVGDTKQAIFGFRGSDPELMDLVLQGVGESDAGLIDSIVKSAGGSSSSESLTHSWRSIRPLVELSNELFVPAFAHILDENKVRLEPVRTETFNDPPIEFWNIAGRDADERLAQGVLDLLRSERLIYDKSLKVNRSVQPCDIAILARTNKKCFAVAKVLAERFIPATVSSPGLLKTPECILALAALRYLADPADTLAAAEIVNLTSGLKPEVWLADRLQFLEGLENGRDVGWGIEGELKSAALCALAGSRDSIVLMSPAEALLAAVSLANVRNIVVSWCVDQHRANQRLANLDILVEYARSYEGSGSQHGIPTIGGMLGWLKELSASEQDMKAAPGSNAVSVMTHHRSKGLEWPVVISIDMEKDHRAGHWGANVFSAVQPQFNDPLKDRRIRYWPFPFGKQQKDIPVKDRIDSSQIGVEALNAAIEENRRLLYVSFTRARDLLVVGLQSDKAEKRIWLNSIDAGWFSPVVNTESKGKGKGKAKDNEEFVEGIGHLVSPNGIKFPVRTRIPIVDETAYQTTTGGLHFYNSVYRKPGLKLRYSPSQVGVGASSMSIGKTERIGDRIDLKKSPDIQLVGNALHAIIAQEFIDGDCEGYISSVQRILEVFRLSDSLTFEQVAMSAKNLRHTLSTKYGATEFIVEWPINYTNDFGQVISGWIDLIAMTPKGMIIVDHKAFPGSSVEWEKKALSYAPQLQAYREGLVRALEKDVVGMFIHMPVVGVMVEITF